ncbi:MAG TPA: UDP-3-O-(3-hydroxymyristoyl)glucosamine N-acyltransferase [Opitutaceae bacterium]|nr:UDP-3-O-(3-hydroxymyristoyl)glucosamine N-acyltransferase [Opitutaceae bacterium]
MEVSFSIDEVIAIVKPRSVRGQTSRSVQGIAGLTAAQVGDLSFLGNQKYKAQVPETQASVVLLPADYVGEPASDQLYLLVENPSAALSLVCARLEQTLWPKPAPGVHPSAVVAASAKIAASATVGPLCVIEEGVEVGERVVLQAQVFLGQAVSIGDDCWLQVGAKVTAGCRLHSRVRLQPGAVVGSDGFGYDFVGGRHVKVPQVGIVEVGSDVEIGANSTLDRARFSRTWVGEGTKIDNLVQIAHNVTIGRHCLICAQAGVSGSTTLEDYVVLGGQAGIGGHITLGKGTKAGGQAGITSDLPAGSFVRGTPGLPFQLEQRINVLKQRLPDLFKRVQTLEAELSELKKSSSTETVR